MKILLTLLAVSLLSSLVLSDCYDDCLLCTSSGEFNCLECDGATGYLSGWSQYYPSSPYSYFYQERSCSDTALCTLAGYFYDATNDLCFTTYDIDDLPGYYLVSDTTVARCDATCLTCKAAADKCTSCHTGSSSTTVDYQFLQLEARYDDVGTCVDECVEGYYRDSSNSCIICHETCRDCAGGEPYECLTCLEDRPIRGSYVYNSQGRCIEECVNGSYDDGAEICNLEGQCQQGMERSGQKCAGTGEEYEAYCCCS